MYFRHFFSEFQIMPRDGQKKCSNLFYLISEHLMMSRGTNFFIIIIFGDVRFVCVIVLVNLVSDYSNNNRHRLLMLHFVILCIYVKGYIKKSGVSGVLRYFALIGPQELD